MRERIVFPSLPHKGARHLGIDVTVHPRGRPDDVEIVLLLFCGKQGLEFVRRRG